MTPNDPWTAGRARGWRIVDASTLERDLDYETDVVVVGTGARTEFGTVNINQDICNGCRYCVSACPFGVITRSSFDAPVIRI